MLLFGAVCTGALVQRAPLFTSHLPSPLLSSRRADVCAMAYSVDDPISVGAALPNIAVEVMEDYDAAGAGSPGVTKPIGEILGGGKSILLGMPGAYTPTCNDVHLPGYYNAAPRLRSMGINTIALVTTNDRFVNAQWQKSMEECMGIPEGSAPVVMLSDARGDLSEALGLIGYLGRALGVRSKRFALVIDNGVVQYKAVDEGSDTLDVTSAENVIKYLEESGSGGLGIPNPIPFIAKTAGVPEGQLNLGAGTIFVLWFLSLF